MELQYYCFKNVVAHMNTQKDVPTLGHGFKNNHLYVFQNTESVWTYSLNDNNYFVGSYT